jgi:hypothetical protein
MPVLDKDFLMLDSTSIAPCMSWSAVRSALVADVLRGSGRLRLRARGEIHGESMLPTLWPGDVVEIESCSLEDVRPGEIVLALREDRLVLHRLVALCEPDGFQLRGDSARSPDPRLPPEALLGRLVRRADEGRGVTAPALRPGLGAKWFGLKGSRALGILFCHCGMVRRLALKLHSYRKPSQREFQDPQSTPDLSSADPRALSS